MSLNPRTSTLIFLILVLCPPFFLSLNRIKISDENFMILAACLFLLMTEFIVNEFILSSIKSIRLLYLFNILNQLVICFLLTIISWYIVSKSINIFYQFELDRKDFTLFIGMIYFFTTLLYILLKELHNKYELDNRLSKFFSVYPNLYDTNKKRLDISLLGQISDILTFLITVILLANSAYSAIESNFAKSTSAPKTIDLSKISEYIYLIPGIAVYSLATYYKIKDFLLKTKNETKSKETM